MIWGTLSIKTERLFAYRVGELDGDGGEIFIMGVHVPQSIDNYKDFVKTMENTEEVLLQSINEIILTESLKTNS